ncbi:hypothetical protein Jden_0500 [Jonesia denitrificans DSM 20603]|uniref:Uncharacterized protein n=1 Tax=Jonesia denitrificans (strain ATCC 14870 / DSM 20603 / BCRC 15368 / CIP 55.134 / JCM 11481 / NBRC 15587 / NCTC 10816 / Prevot 55134) TaxID=471856 RepID=C7R0A5_JONDD|nr:hypothetical protein Jden_0500 [Jonesia denitrificans DSM 20603]
MLLLLFYIDVKMEAGDRRQFHRDCQFFSTPFYIDVERAETKGSPWH